MHLLLPVGALGLDHALSADEPVRRSSEPGCVLVHVQTSLLDEVARVRAVGEDRVRLVVAAPARRIVALEGVRAHRALKRDLAARPQAQAQCGSDVRGGQLALARRVPLRRTLLKRRGHRRFSKVLALSAEKKTHPLTKGKKSGGGGTQYGASVNVKSLKIRKKNP